MKIELLALSLCCLAFETNANCQGDASQIDPNVPEERLLKTKIESVVLYQGRAAITRVATTRLTAGLWRLRFEDLPASIQPETLEAKCGSGRILSVDFSERATPEAASTPDAAVLDAEIRKINQEIATTTDTLTGAQSELKVVESVGVRAATDATKDGGTTKLDLASLDGQLAWMATQRTRIGGLIRVATERAEMLRKDLVSAQNRRNALGGRAKTTQSAEVLLAMTTEGEVPVRLSYLVTDARWEPIYSIRASPDRNAVGLEFDALVIQKSGEDWKGVRLSLSTARPSRAASPPSVTPWIVDVRAPFERPQATSSALNLETATLISADAAIELKDSSAGYLIKRKSVAEKLSEDAVVGGSGPSVTYTIALLFDAPSDDQVRRRARIASFDAPTKFVFQTQPIASDGVFLRGTLSNASPFQLLPGRASVFVGADYVGATPFVGAAPKQEFAVFFGADPAVTARRELIKKEDRQSGLFGGGLDTVSDYRVTISNGTGRSIDMELFDRRPISRSDKIEVNLSASSLLLSRDADYIATQFPQGILRWDLSIPPTPSGNEGTVVTWTVVVSRSKDIEITPLPEK
ncbi:MAG: mucoidy inhibitor MuiA family protein [Planctomycetota bacterium]